MKAIKINNKQSRTELGAYLSTPQIY